MLLFTPGPTPSPESIRLAMSTPTIHHRTKEFEAIFERARSDLKAMLKMDEVLILASSGSGAMEACVRTFTRKKLLVVNSGRFGERFGKIAKSYAIPYTEIKHQWDTPASVDEVLEAFSKDGELDTLAIQICDSSGGLRHYVEAIAQALKAKNADIMVIADAITAMGVEEIDTTNIDALIGGSQKAFMLAPGMSIIGLSSRAVQMANERDIGFYFNLKTELKNQQINTTAWTAPTTIIQGLAKYFDLVRAMAIDSANPLESGLKRVYVETKSRALAFREAIKTIGLKLYPNNPSLAMSTIIDEKNAAPIRRVLKTNFGVNVAGGQDHLKTSILRFNHMGLVDIYECVWAVNAVELALDNLGLRRFDGSANKVFLLHYYNLCK